MSHYGDTQTDGMTEVGVREGNQWRAREDVNITFLTVGGKNL